MINKPMGSKIEAFFTKADREYPYPNAVALQNAERLLNYIQDINLEGPDKFVPTPSDSLYLLWSVEEWQFHIECIKNGSILYTFSRGGHKEASGSYTLDEFIPQLEKYLLLVEA